MVLVFLTRADGESNLQSNAFNFGHYNLSRCRVYVDGRFIPHNDELSEVRLDVDEPTEALSALHWFDALLQASGCSSNFTPGFGGFAAFCNGVSIMAIPLTSDRLSRESNVASEIARCDLHLDFRSALTDSIMVRVVGIYEETLRITRDQKVLLSYACGNF